MSHKISGIYKIICLENKKVYLGSSHNIKKRISRHYSDLKNSRHHNIYLQRAWDKYGKDSFTYEIVKEVEKEEILKVEDEFLKELDFDNSFNIAKNACGGDNISNHPNRSEIVKKMTKSLIKRFSNMTSEERKCVYGNSGDKNGMFNKKHSKSTKSLISKNRKGGSSYRKGKNLEECHGLEESLRLRNILSESAKKRIGDKNPFYGKSHSEKTKKKISESNKGRKTTSQLKPFFIGEKRYLSLMDAQEDTGIPYSTVRWRVKSKSPKYSIYRYE